MGEAKGSLRVQTLLTRVRLGTLLQQQPSAGAALRVRSNPRRAPLMQWDNQGPDPSLAVGAMTYANERDV